MCISFPKKFGLNTQKEKIIYSMNRVKKFILTLVVLLTLSSSASSSVQGMGNFLGKQGEVDTSQTDIEIYAKQNNISLDEAIYRFHISDLGGELDAKLSENEAETFAGMWVEHTPKFKIVVLFTHDGEKTIEPYLTNELEDVVEVQSAEKSLAELQKTQEEVASFILDLKIAVESEIDVYTNTVKIFITETEKAQLDTAVQESLIFIPNFVKVIPIQKHGETEANIYGGLGLANSSGGTSTCTTGFAVQDYAGVRGITTAGYCGENDTRYYNGIHLPLQYVLKTSYYDVSWHTTPGLTVTNQIQDSTSGNLRRIPQQNLGITR